MVQPPRRRSNSDPSALVSDAAATETRALSIRDHVLPLIRMLAGAQRAGGLPVLMAVLGPYTFTYRRPLVGERGKPNRLEIRRRRRLMVLEWTDGDIKLPVFHRGAWEDEVLRLTAPRK